MALWDPQETLDPKVLMEHQDLEDRMDHLDPKANHFISFSSFQDLMNQRKTNKDSKIITESTQNGSLLSLGQKTGGKLKLESLAVYTPVFNLI